MTRVRARGLHFIIYIRNLILRADFSFSGYLLIQAMAFKAKKAAKICRQITGKKEKAAIGDL